MAAAGLLEKLPEESGIAGSEAAQHRRDRKVYNIIHLIYRARATKAIPRYEFRDGA